MTTPTMHDMAVATASSLLVLVLLVPAPATAAPVYEWTDEAGNRHFTDNPYSVPEGYRARPFTPAPPARATNPPATAPTPAPTPPAATPAPAPPAKSLGASEAVREGARLSADEALVLEQRLKADPTGLADRARLLGYYFAGSRTLSMLTHTFDGIVRGHRVGADGACVTPRSIRSSTPSGRG